MGLPGSTQPAVPTGTLRHPFKPLGGRKSILLCTDADAASTSFDTYAHLVSIPEQDAANGVAVGLIPQGCNVSLSFVHNDASADNTTSTVRIMQGFEVGNGEIAFEPVADLALTAGDADVNAGSDLVGDAANELKWVDTISVTTEYLGTPGVNVVGQATNAKAAIEWDARGASYILVLSSKGTADGVGTVVRCF